MEITDDSFKVRRSFNNGDRAYGSGQVSCVECLLLTGRVLVADAITSAYILVEPSPLVNFRDF